MVVRTRQPTTLRIVWADEGKVAGDSLGSGPGGRDGDRAYARRGETGLHSLSRFREAELHVKGTRGFAIEVAYRRNRVELSASEGRAAAIYVVAAGKSGARSGSEESRGFTRVAVDSARGVVQRGSREVCRRSDNGNRSKPEPTYSLLAYARSHGRMVSFTALRPAPGSTFGDESTFFGSSFEKQRGMSTVRLAVTHMDIDTFTIGGPPARPDSATVTPPAPFHGTASFDVGTDGRVEWEGTLAVDLPGATGGRLTGPSFRSSLCLNRRCMGDPAPGATAAAIPAARRLGLR